MVDVVLNGKYNVGEDIILSFIRFVEITNTPQNR